jgi:catechol 2,3-dioxygenase-like lactoylglutathione lyase family enzyme
MAIEHQQRAIDLGIVITDSERSLGFYRDLLGMVHEGDMPMPIGGGGTMHRLRCGDSLIKLVCFDSTPESRAASGGIEAATGYRYFTIHMSNIHEVVDACVAAGVTVVTPVVELRPKVTIAIVMDPDGNLVEFLQMG